MAGQRRQFGFTFLLFVPILAYWGYEKFVKWYSYRKKLQSGCDEVRSGDTETTDICDGPSYKKSVTEASLTADDYREAFANIQQGILVSQDCLVLISLLRSSDTKRLTDGLQLVLKLSVTSTENKNLLMSNGIGEELKRIIRCRKDLPDNVAVMAINAVNNLSLSEMGQLQFVDIVEHLIDVCVGGDNSLAVTSLQCLTNLSVTPDSHSHFTRAINSLYELLDTHSERQLYVCRVLVNLSSSCSVVPYLLAAKRSEMFLFLCYRYFITDSTLPTIYKAASPETMYSFLYGAANHSQLTNALLGRKSGGDEELNRLASQLYKNINLRLLCAPGVAK